jgi:hypothetical protein
VSIAKTPTNEDLIASSVLAWITLNKFKNENQSLIEFDSHRFMIDIYADESDDIVCRKSAQVGFSVFAILRSIWEAKYGGWNVIYALPTNNVVNDFVKPKVNPLISTNPAINIIVKDDSVTYKRVGDRNLFFKGGFSDREAISITGDILVIDEYDRMPSMAVVNTFDSRLQASLRPKRWRFSNPSQVGFGVDGLYNESDMRHWFVKCDHCGHDWFMDWEPDGRCHYVDRAKGIYACGACSEEISDEARRMGHWVTKYPDRKRHGYWISQMMAPWVTARRIIEQYEESSIDFFMNFVIGKAYTPSDMIVDRVAILRACAPSNIPKRNVVIGVDQNVNNQIYVVGTPDGIFAYGKYESWEEIERLKLMYKAIVVIDPNPYPTKPKQLADKYNDVYLCYFQEQKGMHIVNWKGQTVNADRTRLLDMVASEITEAKLLFRMHPSELEEYIADWGNLYRTTVEKDDGRSKSEWLKKEGKNSDYSFATAYYRIGLSKVLGSESLFIEPDSSKSEVSGDTSLGNVISETLNELDP